MGRKSTQEEARDYLASLGLDADEIVTRAAGAKPETFEGYRDEFLALLWERRYKLNDTAFTQALNALARLAEANKRNDDDTEAAHVLVADIVAGNSLLPPERKREILEAELDALEQERGRIVATLDALC